MDKRTLEAVRYLGYGKHAVDDQTLALIRDSFEDLERVAKRRIVYRIFELKVSDEEHLNIEGLEITSRNLAKNMKGCTQVVMLGATLGVEVDMLMKRYSLTEMSRTVVLQACAAAMLEEYCDECQKKIAAELEEEHLYLRPRFSPGYGDFDICYQEPIVRMLNCAKTIGLTLTDSFMMTPTKSVTAVIGISTQKERCPISGCEVCTKKDCEYRR